MEYMLIIIKLNPDFWYKIKKPDSFISELYFFKTVLVLSIQKDRKNESPQTLIRIM